jgi:hypothetical protein
MSYEKPWPHGWAGADPGTPRTTRKDAVAPATQAGTARPSQEDGKDRDLLTTAEAAHVLRLSPRTLERFRVEGTGPSYLKAGPGKRARVLYRVEDLQAWLNQSRFSSTSDYCG